MKTNKIILSLLLALLLPFTVVASGNYVIINQVMYDTPLAEEVGKQGCFNGEFIELYNGGLEKVPLQNWSIHSLSGTSTREVYTLPDITIPAGGYLILASRYEQGDDFVIHDFYQINVRNHPTIRYYNNLILSNKKETLLLIDAQKDTVDRVVFGSQTNLKASNSQGTLGNDCNSLHRIGLELDEQGKIIPAKSQWNTSKVSFGVSQLSNPMFGTQTVFSPNPSTGSSSSANDNNYILSITPLDETSTIKATTKAILVDRGVRVNTTVQYYDDLGRPNELVAVGVTPSKKDLVSTTTYNGLHRATEQYLPTPMDTKGTFTDIATAQQEAKSYFSDTRPFTETLYENSALDRVIGQARPGESYASNPSSCLYSINTETNIRIYTVNGDKLKAEGCYTAYSLFKTTTKDEDGKGEVITFTDKHGRKIMEERSGSRTYFVYDDLNRLRFVLPNLPNSKLTSGEFDLENATLKNIAYCYQYDDRGNMIYKRLPGCEPQYMVYDMTGQLVLKQDGNQRAKDKYAWIYYAYDSIGRNVYITTGRSLKHESQIKYFSDKVSVNEWMNSGMVWGREEEKIGYDRGKRILVPKMLSANFYDTYDFLENVGEGLEYKDGYDAPYSNAKGLLTGTRVYNLSEDGYTTTVYYYDAKGRVIQSRTRRSRDGYETITSSKYNFDGTVAETKTIQEIGPDKVTEHYAYTYDHAGRLLETKYQLDDDPEITLSEFSYDEIGHLAQNLLHNQKDVINYTYDMRNMLTETKNKRFTEQLFYADIPTDEIANATPCRNGNIAAMRVSNYDYGSFTFLNTYDQQNRLTKSCTKYGTQGTGEEFTYDDAGNILSIMRHEGGQVYDDLSFYYGNEGNQLKSVTDYAADVDEASAIEYFELSSSNMSYDANGNNYSDPDRGIKKTTYNILNLPDTVWFENNEAIVNLYDATGNKYKSIVYSIPQSLSHPSPESVYHLYQENSMDYHETTYLGNLEVHRSKVGDYSHVDTIVHNAIGYNKNGTYYHFIKDHLGSNSIVVNTDGDYAVQDMIYHASGVPTPLNDRFGEQPYLYNGKELVESPTYEYNVYDYGFRGYYATIGRFTSMDPLCEKYYHISPYAYCANNFVNAIDPDGRDWYSIFNDAGKREFKYNADIHSQADLDKAKIKGTYMGATKEYNGVYYSLFGHRLSSNSLKGQIYKILDDALIRKAAYEKEEEYLKNHSSPFETEISQSPLISFQVKGDNIIAGKSYRVEYEGGQGIFYPREKYYKGRLIAWPGDSDMPKVVTGYLNESTKPAYHLRYANDKGTRMDLLHIKFDKKNAEIFLQKYQKQFYHK